MKFGKATKPQVTRNFNGKTFDLFSTSNGGCLYSIYGGSWGFASRASAHNALDGYHANQLEEEDEFYNGFFRRVVKFQDVYVAYIYEK